MMPIISQLKMEPVKSEEPPTPSNNTPAPPPSVSTPDAALRGILQPNILGQFHFQPFMLAAAAQAQAAAAQQASLAGFPGVPMFPPAMPADLKPELLMGGGPGPMPFIFGDTHRLYHPYGLDGMKKRNATREATAPLKDWLHSHRKNPYPSKADKVMLAVGTGMTLTQVSTWFANARRRLKKENKMTWSPQNRRGDGGDDEDDDDDDDMNRPSSSTSINSERKGESLFGKPHLASPTPSGGSGGSDDLRTPKKEQVSPMPILDDAESPKRKPKMWSIADVTSNGDSSKKDPPSSDEDHLGNQILQAAMKKQMEIMARLDPNIFRNTMNPFMFQILAQHAAQAQQIPSFLAAQVTPPNEAGLNSQAETSTPSPLSSPTPSPRSHQE